MDVPACFGVYWEGIEGSACLECYIKGDCLAKFAQSSLLKAQQQLSDKATPEALAEITGVAVAAVQLAEQFQFNIGLRKPVELEKSQVKVTQEQQESQEQQEMVPEVTEAQVVNEIEDKPKPKRGRPKKVEPKKVKAKRGRPPKTKVEEKPEKKRRGRPPKIKTEIEAKPEKKKRGRPPKVKTEIEAKPEKKKRGRPPKPKTEIEAKPEKKKRGRPRKIKPEATEQPIVQSIPDEVVDRPTMAGAFVTPAKVPAKSKQRSAKTVSERAGTRTWNPLYDQKRWERERERSPVLAQLRPGQVLTREWPPKSGTHVQVKVLKHRYQWQDREYPTLYSTVKAITGVKASPKQKKENGTRPKGNRSLAPWSAVKFFRDSLIQLGCYQALKKLQDKKTKPKVSPKKRPPKRRPPKKKILYTT